MPRRSISTPSSVASTCRPCAGSTPSWCTRAEADELSYRDFLAVLFAEEVAHRAQTRIQRCVRRARFPFLKTIEEFDFTFQASVRLALLGSSSVPSSSPQGHCLIASGPSGTGKTHLAVAIAYRAIQNGFEARFTTATALIDDLSAATRKGRLRHALPAYTHPHVLVIDEVGYLTYGPDAANVLFHVVNERYLHHRPMLFTTNKPLPAWGRVLHDPDLAQAILDRVLERGRLLELRGPSYRTRHVKLDLTQDPEPSSSAPARISGNRLPEFPEPTCSCAPRTGPLHDGARAGLRLGELFGLEWGDLDVHGHFIEVRRSRSGGQVTTPKNGESRRVDMSDQLAETFQRLRVERKVETLKSGWGQVPETVFVTEAGRPYDAANLRQRIFYRTLTKAGIRRVRLHDLRHTYARLLIQQRESLAYMRDQMGHSSIKVTVDTYGHPVPGANRQAVNRLDDFSHPAQEQTGRPSTGWISCSGSNLPVLHPTPKSRLVGRWLRHQRPGSC